MIKTNIVVILLMLILAIESSCSQNPPSRQTEHMEKQYKYNNHLVGESSPYLQQHAHNPVDWYPWSDEALQKAKRENKMMIISIGYSACHWCHVMEHESFEDTTVANKMNKDYVAIKVDREERPDIDQIYMNAVQLMTGRGGWPLNVLALPDGRPFYAGTYFQKKDWINVLDYFAQLFKNNPQQLIEQAGKVTQGIAGIEMPELNKNKPAFSMNDLNSIFEVWKKHIDFENGGSKGAHKFPMPNQYEFLLYYHYLTGDKEALKATTLSLDKMAMGGIFDHLGGGFARYSTDANWFAPHFEKMLYDNAQLVSLYSTAYRQTQKPLYKRIVEATLSFIAREMTSSTGGFYSSLDADSEGEEGKYYVWKYDEIIKILGDKADLFCEYFNVKKSGNWQDGNNILYRTQSDSAFMLKHHLSQSQLTDFIDEAKEKLMAVRNQRQRPGLDDKILTSWNALMLSAYIDAYRTFGEDKYLDEAVSNANFLMKNAIGKDYQLLRNCKKGQTAINGFLDDYAFLITAFIDLYQATFEEQWLTEALGLSQYVLKHFYDNSSGMFFYTSDESEPLIARKIELSDNVIPASNSELAIGLYKLGLYFYKDSYIDTSRQMLNNIIDDIKKMPRYYSNWAILLSMFIKPPYEVAIAGPACRKKRVEFDRNYLPDALFLGGVKPGSLQLLKDKFVQGKTMIYVCQNKTCRLPVTEVQKALSQIK